MADLEALARESARLEELRLVALEGRIEADVELGLAAEAAGELEGLVAEYPLRERLWRLLVLALYRCGRQADALGAHRRARAVLVEELGIEPGEELRAMEQAVLRQQVPAAAPRRAQHNLPARLTSFVGRERELAVLDELVAGARLVTVTGAGGAGKTRLAVEFAAGAAGRFADGAWLASVAGITLDPAHAAELAETLTFLAEWLSGSHKQAPAESFAAFIGHPAYNTGTLCTDLRRFVFLLGASDGEELFGEPTA